MNLKKHLYSGDVSFSTALASAVGLIQTPTYSKTAVILPTTWSVYDYISCQPHITQIRSLRGRPPLKSLTIEQLANLELPEEG